MAAFDPVLVHALGDPDELISISRLAAILEIDRSTAYVLAHEIGVVRVTVGGGRRIRVARRDLQAWIEANRENPRP